MLFAVFDLIADLVPGEVEVNHTVRTEVLFQGNQFAARKAVEEHGVKYGRKSEGRLVVEKAFKVAWSNAIDATQFNRF